MSLGLVMDFEELCERQLSQQVDKITDEYMRGRLSVNETAAALREEQARLVRLSEVFYRGMGIGDAAATDETQDIPSPPIPTPAETKIVRIHWRDACSAQGWHFKHEIEEQGLSLVESVGWLVGEDDSCVKLAISVSDGVAGNMTVIPKSGIVDRWEFKG